MSDPASTPLTLRTVTDDDWAAMSLLFATSFGEFGHPDTLAAWRTLMPSDSAVVVCDGDDIVGMSVYLDLRLTVPGGTELPVAGISMVAVAPTHRRRGVLRTMLTELHRRIADAGYPIAALTASEGGIYGRFGYGPATIEQQLTIDRRFAHFHADVPDPGGVRMVTPAEHRDELAAIYERWRRRTPGGLFSPDPLWDEVLADRESARDGGSALFAFLHRDGFALYRVHGEDPMVVRIEKVAAVTTDAYIALWRALIGLDLMDNVVIGTHPDDPLPYLLTDARRVRITASQDDLWLRLMDIPAALEARSYRGELSVVLEVSDGFCSDGGTFALQIHDGQARCQPTQAPADAHMDIDVLGSLYFGVHRASALVVANRLRCKDPELVHRLDAAFGSDVPAQLGYGF